jgi:hypothetical protein
VRWSRRENVLTPLFTGKTWFHDIEPRPARIDSHWRFVVVPVWLWRTLPATWQTVFVQPSLRTVAETFTTT